VDTQHKKKKKNSTQTHKNRKEERYTKIKKKRIHESRRPVQEKNSLSHIKRNDGPLETGCPKGKEPLQAPFVRTTRQRKQQHREIYLRKRRKGGEHTRAGLFTIKNAHKRLERNSGQTEQCERKRGKGVITHSPTPFDSQKGSHIEVRGDPKELFSRGEGRVGVCGVDLAKSPVSGTLKGKRESIWGQKKNSTWGARKSP